MYRVSSDGWFKYRHFILLDLLCMQVGLYLAYIMRHGLKNPYNDQLYRNEALVLLLFQILVFVITETYKNLLKRGWYLELIALIKCDFFIMVPSLLFLYLTKNAFDFSRFVFIVSNLIYIALSYVTRILLKKHMMKQAFENEKKNSIILVTTSDFIETVVNKAAFSEHKKYKIFGLILIDKDLIGEKYKNIPIVGSADKLTEYICHEWVDEVLVCLPDGCHLTHEQISAFLLMGITVHEEIEIFDEIGAGSQFIEKVGNIKVLTTSTNIVPEKMLICKRCVDIIGGLIGCILTCVLFIFIAPAIYIKSPGPIFFSQVRIGRNGRKFKMYKFRSMYMDAEERKAELMVQNRVKDGMMFKLDFDPRIIGSEKKGRNGKPKGIGNFIRRTSIDEFPQFFNVLKGDMSLVGTRPPTLDEWEKYKPHHRARMAIKPGITGAWQTSGRSEITDFEEIVKLDTDYIIKWNNGLDFKIIFKTIKSVIKKDGSM